MSNCRLKIFGQEGLIREEAVALSSLDRGPLGALCSAFINRTKKARVAVLEDDGRLRALFLYTEFLPGAAVRFGAPISTKGVWLTQQAFVGHYGGGRLLVGPAALLRQIDLSRDYAPFTARLYQLEQLNGVQPRFEKRPNGQTFAFQLAQSRYYFCEQGARFVLMGAGNTPQSALDAAVNAAAATNEADFFRTVGATAVLSQADWAASR